MMIAGLRGVPFDQVDSVPVGSANICPVAHRDFPAAQLPAATYGDLRHPAS